jgi:2-polyprenyl-3-methyl-5-hydroxy-6-metoxy-1,4-benzoquinol methylase
MRACPFCDSTASRAYGNRRNASYLRCRACRSIFMDLSREAFDALHANAFADDEFARDILAARGSSPDVRTWGELASLLPDGPVLEIGPGSGHLLAAARAAGRTVTAVESSAVHRNFIRRTWGIDDVHESLDRPGLRGRRFRGIILINTLEHVFEVGVFLRALARHLEPGGVIFLSTVNAVSFIGRVVGTMWSSFKPDDHVSFPSPHGLRTAAHGAGLEARRVWTGELPLETPAGLLVAARDLVKERILRRSATAATGPANGNATNVHATPLSRRLMRELMERARNVDPLPGIVASFEAAATVKALLVAKG